MAPIYMSPDPYFDAFVEILWQDLSFSKGTGDSF
jgi:hypothetical protein